MPPPDLDDKLQTSIKAHSSPILDQKPEDRKMQEASAHLPAGAGMESNGINGSTSATTSATPAADRQAAHTLPLTQEPTEDCSPAEEKKHTKTDADKAESANTLAALGQPATLLPPIDTRAVDSAKELLECDDHILGSTIWISGSTDVSSRITLADVLASSWMTANTAANATQLEAILGLIVGLFSKLELPKLQDFHAFSRALEAMRLVDRDQSADGQRGAQPVDPLERMFTHQLKLFISEQEAQKLMIRRVFGHIKTVQLHAELFLAYGSGPNSDLARKGQRARQDLRWPQEPHNDMNAVVITLYKADYVDLQGNKASEKSYQTFSKKYRTDLNCGRVLQAIQQQLGPGALVMLSTYTRWDTDTAEASASIMQAALDHILQRFPQLQGMFDNLQTQLWGPMSTHRPLGTGFLGYEIAHNPASLHVALSRATGPILSSPIAEAAVAYLHREGLMDAEDSD